MIKITDIKLNESNPRTIKDERFSKLLRSMVEFPRMMELRPIVVDRSGLIIGGNMRYRAIVDLGYTEIPDEWVKVAEDLTEDEARRFVIEDNVSVGEWDFDLLVAEFSAEELSSWGLDIPIDVISGETNPYEEWNDVPFRWRGRYNEDTILSLDMLKAGWCTVQFNAFLQQKMTTQTIKGGNTDEFYHAEGEKKAGARYADNGTVEKSKMLVNVHPDVARMVWKFHRWHHQVDYSRFKGQKLIRRDEVELSDGVNDYGMRLIKQNA